MLWWENVLVEYNYGQNRRDYETKITRVTLSHTNYYAQKCHKYWLVKPYNRILPSCKWYEFPPISY